MFRKMIALLTVFAMLVPLSSAVAAEESASQPTIEEILNSYHEKAFAAKTAEESGGASTYARSGSGSSQTLEQETVAELTAAGYEAYNVTGDNYETLEETLHTDFAEMGLDPNCSYIIVFSGEESGNDSNTNPNSRIIDLPAYDDFDGDAGSDSSYIFYSEHGGYYQVRQITITASQDSGYAAEEAVDLLSNPYSNNFSGRLLEHIFFSALDTATESNYGTILSLLGVELINSDLAQQARIEVNVGANRTRKYTQIFDEDDSYAGGGRWLTCFSTEYVRVNTYVDVHYYDPQLNGFRNYQSDHKVEYLYCPSYLYPSQQNECAVEAYIAASVSPDGSIVILHELINDINIYVVDEQGNYLNNSPVITIRPYIGTTP